MDLQLLYYADKVHVNNPQGHIGILTLWSRTDVILKQLGPLPPSVAAVANLYGDGLSQLLVNLLYNPQIRVLHVVGANRSHSLDDLQAYFQNGVEDIQVNGSWQKRICGTSRLLNTGVPRHDAFMTDPPAIIVHTSVAALKETLQRPAPYFAASRSRQRFPLIEPVVKHFPSIQTGHQIIGDNLVDAWRELLFHVSRFGNLVTLAKGQRRELYNVKVVIRDPAWLPADAYPPVGLDKARLHDYARQLFDPLLPADTAYTYGHRLRSHFGHELIPIVQKRLEADQGDRGCYISLWDTAADLLDPDAAYAHHSVPCWVGAYWRLVDNRLLMSAIFRTHRAYTAWVENAHSLSYLNSIMANAVASDLGREVLPGPLTIYSQSVGIDPAQQVMVDGLVAGRTWHLRDDGRGQLTFSIEKGKIVVEHKLDGLPLKRYEGKRADILAHQLALDAVVGDLGHALYVGKELGKLQMCLKYGLKYEESV